MSKLLSKLSKAEILSLPGFEKYKKYVIRQLKPLLKQSIKDLGINFRGVRVNDYVEKYEKRKADDEKLFNRISNMKKDRRSYEQYKQGLKDNALFERSFMNLGELYSLPKPSEDKQYIESLMNIDAMYSTKSNERIRYEENVTDKTKYQQEMKRMMIAVKNHESFEVDIGDDSEIQYAFTKVLRQIRKMKSDEWRPLVYGYDMNGKKRVFNINRESNIEDMIRCILGEITIEEYSSDSDPGLIGWDYIPVRFEIKFIKMIKNKETKKTEFIEKIDGEEVVIESVDNFRNASEGGFFPYINLIKGLESKL